MSRLPNTQMKLQPGWPRWRAAVPGCMIGVPARPKRRAAAYLPSVRRPRPGASLNGDDLEALFAEPDTWQQHYPTYTYSGRDIMLAEYQAAATSAAAEEKLFLSSSNVALIVAAAVSSLALGSLNRLYDSVAGVLLPYHVVAILVGLLLLFSALTLKHFAERQKAIQFAKRKLVVLRAMLGLDYGPVQLVLPNWRLEGATQPFAIRLFPGWVAYAAYPFWIIATFASVVLFYVLSHFLTRYNPDWQLLSLHSVEIAALFATAWFLVLALQYRTSLHDVHERSLSTIASTVAAVLRLTLVGSMEYVIYRSKLAAVELRRLGYALDESLDLLLFIEDRGFHEHRGVSIRGLARALRDRIKRRRISGGSTITQQLSRTLFIVDYRKTYRRKLVETLLALWLERVFAKQDILHMYVASVRYAASVMGFAAASKHFFNAPTLKPSRAQAFFLFERISNIRNRILVRRIDHLVTQSIAADRLSSADAAELAGIYAEKAAAQLTPDDQEAFARFLAKWSSQPAGLGRPTSA